MALFCFIFYTLVTVLFLILCIGEHMVIKEINRRTRAQGSSPLIG